MPKPIRLLVMLTSLAVPISGYTQGFIDLIGKQPLSQSISEYVELLVTTPDLPPGLAGEATTLTYRLELHGDPSSVNVVDVEATIGSVARFKIEVGSVSGKGRLLLVNGQALCCAFEDAGRVTSQVSVRSGANPTFISGGEIPILLGERARDVNISIVHVDSQTGATSNVDYILRPTLRVVRTDASD